MTVVHRTRGDKETEWTERQWIFRERKRRVETKRQTAVAHLDWRRPTRI